MSVRAVARGTDIVVFGSPVSIGSSAAAIDSRSARASAAGVNVQKSTVTSAKVDSPVKRQANRACVEDLVVLDLVSVQAACGESRAQTLPPLLPDDLPRHIGAAMLDPAEVPGGTNPTPRDDGGPQAVGRGSASRVDVRDTRLLEPALGSLRTLLTSLGPVSGQTLTAAADSIDPASSGMLRPLAAGLGLRPSDIVRPVSTLLEQLLDGAEKATALVWVTPPASTATANTKEQKVIALARSEPAQVDLLPGLGLGGQPLLSIFVGPAESTMAVDRVTAARKPNFAPAETRIRLGLPLAGPGVAEMAVPTGSPITLLAGTPLETTVSAGGGRNIENPEDGPVSSFVDGVSVQLLKGLKSGAGTDGIDLQLARVEASVGGGLDPPGSGPLPRALMIAAGSLVLAVSVALFAHTARRRRVTAT